MIPSLGKQKRLHRIFRRNGRAFIVPIDDLLICGPSNHLEQFDVKIRKFNELPIDAVLGFPGVFGQSYDSICDKAWIINLTTSTKLGDHTSKNLALTLKSALYYGADAIAVHVNMSSPDENNMIQNLGLISCECQEFGIPLMAIMYVRKPKSGKDDDNYETMRLEAPDEYTRLVSHACRVAVELGADIIKTSFTGSRENFHQVVRAAGNVPVVIAGGDYISEEEVLANTENAIAAGASGVCFGRNFFYRDNIHEFALKVSSIISNA